MKFSKRSNQFGEGIFSKLLEIKNQKLADGEPIIDLSVGTPNIPPADHIIHAMCSADSDKNSYIYSISDLSELLEAVSLWYKNRYRGFDPTEVCSLLGTQEGFAYLSMQ